MSEKTYELRPLEAADLFPVLKLLNKIGIKEIKTAFQSDSVKTAVSGMKAKKGGDKDALAEQVGIEVAFEVAGIVLSNIPECEHEIFGLLSAVTGLEIQSVRKLPPADVIEIIYQIIHKEEFKDFFKAVSKFFK